MTCEYPCPERGKRLDRPIRPAPLILDGVRRVFTMRCPRYLWAVLAGVIWAAAAFLVGMDPPWAVLLGFIVGLLVLGPLLLVGRRVPHDPQD